MAHADGGAVRYADAAADADLAVTLAEASLDRPGVCNRLNLLLVHPARRDELLPRLRRRLARLGISMSLPPHAHPLGHERALDAGHEATVTIAPAGRPCAAALIASEETSGPAAAIVTADQGAAAELPGAYAGDRRVLERHHPPARRVQAAVRAPDRHHHRRRARPPAARSPSATCTCVSSWSLRCSPRPAVVR